MVDVLELLQRSWGKVSKEEVEFLLSNHIGLTRADVAGNYKVGLIDVSAKLVGTPDKSVAHVTTPLKPRRSKQTPGITPGRPRKKLPAHKVSVLETRSLSWVVSYFNDPENIARRPNSKV